MLRSLIRRIVPKLFFISNKNKIVVLAYHRIDYVKTDPWQISVSPENFEEQLKVLTSKFKVISLDEFNKQVSSNKIESNQVLITFDDAYSDNYRYAKPLLEKYNCPAVFFVPTSYIGQNKLFWADELNNIILQSRVLPTSLNLKIAGNEYLFGLKEATLSDKDWEANKKWNIFSKDGNERGELYLEIWAILQPLPQDKIDHAIDEIRVWASYKAESDNDYPMNLEQLKEISENKLFDIGVHTHTHPALAYANRDIQYKEIATCKAQLEQNLNKPITSIAYPYGSYNKTTISIVEELKLSTGFSTKTRTIHCNKNKYAFGRFQPFNWDGNQFKKNIDAWFYYSFFMMFI